MKNKVLFTDGEGPIVFKDLAFDVMGRITLPENVSGHDFFSVLSLYDDYLAEKGIEGYQAGDTLALVVPHWLTHNITDENILEESRTAQLVRGVKEYIEGLKADDWKVRIISTAYRPLWNLVGEHLGIPQKEIACTEINLSRLKKQFYSQEFSRIVDEAEHRIISLMPQFDKAKQRVEGGAPVERVFSNSGPAAQIRIILDQLYWRELPRLGYRTLEVVEVIGGRRKVEAVKRFAGELKVPLKGIAYVGDSITDDTVHKFLAKEGGLPIAFNGNYYALRNARVGVVTVDARYLRPLLDVWVKGEMQGVESFIKSEDAGKCRYHLLDRERKKEFQKILEIHKIFRKKVRGSAAALG